MIEASATLAARAVLDTRPRRATLATIARLETQPRRGTLTARPVLDTAPRPATLRARGVLSAVPDVQGVEAWATLTARARLDAVGVRRVPAEAVLTSRAPLAAVGHRRIPATAALAARAKLLAVGTRRVPAAATLSARPVLHAVGELQPDPSIDTIEAALRAFLLGGALGELVGRRVYLHEAPRETEYPLLTIDLEREYSEAILDGRTNRRVATISITVWAKDTAEASGYSTARMLAERVRETLVRERFRRGTIDVDGIEEDAMYPLGADETTGVAETTIEMDVFYAHI